MSVVKAFEVLSDYSPVDGTRLRVTIDDQGDVYFGIYDPEEGSSPTVRIAQSGTRTTQEFRTDLRAFVSAIEAERDRTARSPRRAIT